MSGLQLIERLKAEGDQLPAIVITGSGVAVPMAVQAMKGGAVDFIEKPVGHAELLSVKRALDQMRDAACRKKLEVPSGADPRGAGCDLSGQVGDRPRNPTSLPATIE